MDNHTRKFLNKRLNQHRKKNNVNHHRLKHLEDHLMRWCHLENLYPPIQESTQRLWIFTDQKIGPMLYTRINTEKNYFYRSEDWFELFFTKKLYGVSEGKKMIKISAIFSKWSLKDKICWTLLKDGKVMQWMRKKPRITENHWIYEKSFKQKPNLMKFYISHFTYHIHQVLKHIFRIHSKKRKKN